MFLVQALYPFSSVVLEQQQQVENNEQKKQVDENITLKQNSRQHHDPQQKDQKLKQNGRKIQDRYSLNNEEKQQTAKHTNQEQKDENQQITYLKFDQGDKILVIQAYQSGWWYGNTLKNPDIKGYFPQNYVQVATKIKPPPPPPSQPAPQDDSNEDLVLNEQKGIDWVQNELKNVNKGPLQSAYYLGIKGYKNVKIDQKNQNILKGDHVKFDVSTGLAKVPVKDQAPAAKAVRQMGYYFDYHEWVQARNKNPQHRARPDPKKKKIKKLNLKGMH